MTEVKRYGDLAGTQGVATSAYGYDALGRLTQLNHVSANKTLAAYQLRYDAKSRLTQLQSNDGVSTYGYDANDQITGVDHSYQRDEVYTYDATGNRVDKGYNTTKNNQLHSDGKFNYHYDKQGNLIRKQERGTGEETEYTWDYRNRLTQVTVKRKGKVVEQVGYTYDAFDRRISKTVDADGEGKATPETEYFVYDGEHIALVFDEQGRQTHRYLYGPQIDQILADEVATGEVRWALTDHQGTVRDVIDSQGNVLNHISYDSFGNVTNESNPNVDFRFGYTGREFDEETGQYYYRARYYDAGVGRFISEDPLGFGAGDANLYRYVGNSPTNYTDPTGNFSLAQVASITASTAVIYAIPQLLLPNPAQTPTNPCDKDPTDNSGKRQALEIALSLGLAIGPAISRQGFSILDDVLRSNKSGVGNVGDDFTPPQILRNRHNQLTNGTYTLDRTGMEPHLTGSLGQGKSQFLSGVDADRAVLDAAAYADRYGLWKGSKATAPVSNGPVGVHGRTGELTNTINVYRNRNGFVHGAPGSPQ
jgi:RHS repeat-associated protein